MKIAQITTIRVNNAFGGTEKVFFSMANALTARGHQVGCFYYDTNDGGPAYAPDDKVFLKNAYSLSRLKREKKLAKLRASIVLSRRRRREIRKIVPHNLIVKDVKAYKPDVVLLYWPDEIIYSLLKLNIPVILMMHMDANHFEGHSYFHFAKKGLEKCDSIQVLMQNQVAQLRRVLNNDNIVCIPNIVPQYNQQSNNESHTIIFIGRMADQKRPWLIAEAFALLKDKYPDWRVELWGEAGFDQGVTDRVKGIIQEHGLENNIIFCGTTLDIKSKLENSSIILMPSEHEGFSLALTEAMSMGLPAVICRDCTSCDALIRHGENGYSCEPTAEGIAQYLDKLMGSLELRKTLGSQAREDMKLYSEDVVCDMWLKLMQEVIDKRKNRT